MNEIAQNGSGDRAWTQPPDSHQEYEELCALSTTGELTAKEWEHLGAHLAQCNSCRDLKRQYERVVKMAIPAVAPAIESDNSSEPESWSIEDAEAALMESIREEPVRSRRDSISRAKPFHWPQVRRYAVAALILVCVTAAGYRVGVLRSRGSGAHVRAMGSTLPNPQSSLNPSDSLTIAALQEKIRESDGKIVKLESHDRTNRLESATLRDKLSQSEEDLAKRTADLEQSLRDRAELGRELAQAQASAQTFEARQSATRNQTSQDTAELLALKTRIEDLNASLEGKDREIADQRELLQHDRDIRNLIGARNLYIAEIYDVAKSGATQKPFGRVFYTKGKSLIFYGYDLDEQRGLKKDTIFQAWGSRGADRKHAVSLGLLYQDDASQKRWVLKFNDPKTIAEIDAVFVTVEPEGGSSKPTSKPLLFTYLRLEPNHP